MCIYIYIYIYIYVCMYMHICMYMSGADPAFVIRWGSNSEIFLSDLRNYST